jgi:hypothetical protein
MTVVTIAVLLAGSGCGEQENTEGKKRAPRVSLHVAAFQGNVAVVEAHIAAGSDLNEKDAYGSSPLIIAATFGKTGVARALIAGGADLSVANAEGATPLHVAAFLCRREIVQALLDKGADKSVRDRAGATALASVAGPFDDVKDFYDRLGRRLAPLGLRLDYERIKRTRPQIAEMLRQPEAMGREGTTRAYGSVE